MKKKSKIGFISLGCPKNQVDAEQMLAALDEAGFEIVDYVDGCDAVIVNTCGFIDDAKKEAIENILDMVELKNEGVINSIIVTGCLAERYQDEIDRLTEEIKREREKNICLSNNIGVGNTFVWASKYSNTQN